MARRILWAGRGVLGAARENLKYFFGTGQEEIGQDETGRDRTRQDGTGQDLSHGRDRKSVHVISTYHMDEIGRASM